MPSATTDLQETVAEFANPDSTLRRIADGDSSAVSDCIEQYGDLLWFLAKRYCPSESDAEDAVQDIFIELWQKAERFNPAIASEETFVTMIARRRLIDRRRRSTSGLVSLTCQDEQLETLECGATETNTGSTLERTDEAAKASACMEKLSPVQQSVLTMNICEGQTQSSIAESLQLPLGTVKSFARRGLIFLRDCMNRPATFLTESRPS